MDTVNENFRFKIFKGNTEIILSRILLIKPVRFIILFPLCTDDGINIAIVNSTISIREIESLLRKQHENENQIYLFQPGHLPDLPHHVSVWFTSLKMQLIASNPEEVQLLAKIMKKLFRLQEATDSTVQRLYLGILLQYLQEILYRERTFNTREETIANNFIKILSKETYPEHQVKYYADRLFISRRYLTKIVHRTLGESPKALIDMQILTIAKKLLGTSDTIYIIAEQLKFDSPATFSTFFKKHSGSSPSAYRETLLKP